MFLSHQSLNGRHVVTAFCRQGAERKGRCLAEYESKERSETAFTEYGIPLAHVTSFKYLRRILTAEDDDWPEMVKNRWKASQKWERLMRVMGI